MSTTDFARTPLAERKRREKAQRLADWLYDNGIGPAIATQEPAVLRAAARRAGVTPPHTDPSGSSPTWQLVAQCLQDKVRRVRASGGQPPRHVMCIPCAVHDGPCPRHPLPPTLGPVACLSCGSPADPALTASGMQVHPSCPDPPAAAARAMHSNPEQLPIGEPPAVPEMRVTG